MKKFSEWLIEKEAKLKEAATDSGDCAHYPMRMPIGGKTRMNQKPIVMPDQPEQEMKKVTDIKHGRKKH